MWAAVCAGVVALPVLAGADTTTVLSLPPEEPPVLVYDLSGPRIGATMDPKGNALGQFGWHFEPRSPRRPKGWSSSKPCSW